MSDGSIKPSATPYNSVALAINYICIKTRLKLDESYLKQDKIKFTNENTVNIYFVFEKKIWWWFCSKKWLVWSCKTTQRH